MPVELAHFGEDVVHEMVCQLGQKFLDLCPGFKDQKIAEPIAIKEASLDGYAGLTFDGASRIDMVLLLEGNLGLPFEIKLGSTRLSRTRIDDEWLCGCKNSHLDTKSQRYRRWSGNMMSILERKFADSTASESLCARYGPDSDLQHVTLTPQWFVIARKRIIESWDRPGARPAFSSNVGTIPFESIVEKYEAGGVGRQFNALVRGLLAFDFYDRWIVGGKE